MTAITDLADHQRGFNEEVWNGKDLDAIERYIHEDFVMYDPARPEEIHGPEAVRESVGMLLSAFPDTHAELVNHVSEGGMVAVHNVVTGTHEGEYLGIEPTRRSVEIDVKAVQRIEDGRIVEEWQLADRLSMLVQLGAVEPPSPPGELPSDVPTAPPTTEPGSPEANKRLVRRIPQEVVNGRNPDLLDELLHPDVVDHSPLGETTGIEPAKQQLRQMLEAFPDLEVTVEDAIADDRTVAARVTWRATNEGPFLGMDPTGRDVEFQVIAFLRISGDRIVERWILADQLTLMQQLGLADPMGG